MDLFKTLFATHVVCGGTSLITGLLLLLLPKGDNKHIWMGNIYFIAMLTASLVALPMSCLHPNFFLFIVGVFTIYLLVSGKRYLKKKKPEDVKLFDWVLTGTMFVFGILFIGFGMYNLLKGNYFGIVLLVFGSIGILSAYQDNVNFKDKSSVQNFWLTTHLQRMTGSYIASATAFLVVNNKILPGIIAWLLPTIILAPFIIKWTKERAIKKV